MGYGYARRGDKIGFFQAAAAAHAGTTEGPDMCLILLAYRVRPDAPLIVAANRDEFYARPATTAHCWPDSPAIFAGRDLQAGGTWLGVSVHGRFAAVTNFSEVTPEKRPASRGDLVRGFLESTASASAYGGDVERDRYAGFSVVLFDGRELVYLSNREGEPYAIAPGIHGLANTHLDAEWPKVRRGVAALTAAVQPAPDPDRLLHLLADSHLPPDCDLPQRGREVAFERRVAPCFIRGDQYGTRASTAVIFGQERIRFVEQGFGPGGVPTTRVDETLARREG
jgi:uncharacterized protein with NRDE domain